MDIKLINIGFGNIVAANRIISIISPESAPIKRIIQEARDNRAAKAPFGRQNLQGFYAQQKLPFASG